MGKPQVAIADDYGGEAVFHRLGPWVVEEFADYLESELERHQRTIENYLKSLDRISRYCDKPPWKLDHKDLRAFKKSPYAISTRHLTVVAVKQFHQFGALEGYWSLNGIMQVRSPKKPEGHEKPPLSHETARRLLEACGKPLETRVVYLGLFAGTRVSEAAAMNENHWRTDRLIFTGKRGKKRTVPLHRALVRVRAEILSQLPKTGQVLEDTFAKLRDRISAKDLEGRPATTHSLRRTFSDTLYNDCEVPWEVVACLLGHKLPVTGRYTQPRYPRLRAAIDALDYYLGEPVQLAFF